MELIHHNYYLYQVKFLVDLRAELILLAREDEALRGLEVDLKGLLVSWFDVGFSNRP